MFEASLDKDHLVLRIPLQAKTLSASGKTFVVASTHGIVKTGIKIDGQQLSLGVNAFVPNTKFDRKAVESGASQD